MLSYWNVNILSIWVPSRDSVHSLHGHKECWSAYSGLVLDLTAIHTSALQEIHRILQVIWIKHEKHHGDFGLPVRNLFLFPSFHPFFLIAWLADGDSLMCYIVTMGRLIAQMFSTFSLWGCLFIVSPCKQPVSIPIEIHCTSGIGMPRSPWLKNTVCKNISKRNLEHKTKNN